MPEVAVPSGARGIATLVLMTLGGARTGSPIPGTSHPHDVCAAAPALRSKQVLSVVLPREKLKTARTCATSSRNDDFH
jgi:hypothetical protein